MWRQVLLLVFFLLLLYVVIPRLGDFSASLESLGNARPGFVAVGLVFVAATYCFAAGTYYLLALKPRLRYRSTLAIQAASAFANRLLPAGLGGMTLGVQYLRKQKYTTSQAAVVVGMNNLVGGAGHLVLLGATIVLSADASVRSLAVPDVPQVGLVVTAILGVLAVTLWFVRTIRQHVRAAVRQVVDQLLSYRNRPWRLMLALGSSMGMTACYAMVLYLSALSLGVELSLVQISVVFTVGVAAATATPTPGGLVGAEAGLAAGMVVYGVEGPAALAVALLYRFLTYWLPLLPGFAVFIAVRKLYLPGR